MDDTALRKAHVVLEEQLSLALGASLTGGERSLRLVSGQLQRKGPLPTRDILWNSFPLHR